MVGFVEYHEQKAQALFQLGLPLLKDGGGRGDDDALDLFVQQQLAGDQAGFDGDDVLVLLDLAPYNSWYYRQFGVRHSQHRE